MKLSKQNSKILGVCSGIAEHYNIDSTLVRFLFVLMLLIPGLPGILIYLILWLLME
jgi:phage shock protein PspC (stress-responsive transcriptional regulator)